MSTINKGKTWFTFINNVVYYFATNCNLHPFGQTTLVRTKGSCWMKTEDYILWKVLGKAYVHQWADKGC